MNSLGKQLQVGLALGLLLLLVLLWWGGSLALRNLTEGFVASRLQHDAETLLATLDLTAAGAPSLSSSGGLGKIYRQPLSGHYYQVVFVDGTLLTSRSLWDQRLEFPLFTPGTSGHWRMVGPDRQDLLLHVAGYRKQGKLFTLALAEDMTPLNQGLVRFQWVFASLSLLAAVLIILIQSQIVRGSMRRLDPVREGIRRLVKGEITALTEDIPSEVKPLVQEFNRLLQIQQGRLEQSRNGLGNLAHALKGPLNLLIRQLEREELVGYPEVRQGMELQVERIRKLMERELTRARLAGTGIAAERFQANQEIPALVGALHQLYAERRLEIEYQLPDEKRLPQDREDMLELLGNLLDNACKWAQKRVRLRLETGDNMTRLLVEDDGQGVSDDELERLSERGVRIDESVAGHGLGLAIARDVVNRYGGTLRFGRSADLEGLQVTVELPR
ncbi:MAG: sensor histidine kinase [Candidatus Sedimenticola sp. (ex Thyasira tokunagai)]